MLYTRNMWFNTLWYNNHMRCNSVWYTIIRYVTGVLYNMLYDMFAPLAAVFRGSHVPAAPEPPASLSPGLAWMVTTRILRPDRLHVGLLAKWQAAALYVEKYETWQPMQTYRATVAWSESMLIASLRSRQRQRRISKRLSVAINPAPSRWPWLWTRNDDGLDVHAQPTGSHDAHPESRLYQL